MAVEEWSCSLKCRVWRAHPSIDISATKCWIGTNAGDDPKVDILKNNNKASLLFYDKEEKIQLRVKVECEINNQNSVTEASWKKTQHISRRCYLTDSPPGTVSENPTSGMISKLEDFDYTMEQSEDGYKNFTVIKCNIKSIEWLYLAAKGHRRAKFDLENNKNNWLVP